MLTLLNLYYWLGIRGLLVYSKLYLALIMESVLGSWDEVKALLYNSQSLKLKWIAALLNFSIIGRDEGSASLQYAIPGCDGVPASQHLTITCFVEVAALLHFTNIGYDEEAASLHLTITGRDEVITSFPLTNPGRDKKRHRPFH